MVGIRKHYADPCNNTLVPQPSDHEKNIGVSRLHKEEYEVEREIIKMILNGNTNLLKPNCPNGITIREHHIYVMLLKQDDPKFQLWGWHGWAHPDV